MGMKSTSGRFKVSMLMTVPANRYHQQAVPTKRARNAESSTKIGCISEYATGEQFECSIGGTLSSIPTTSLPTETQLLLSQSLMMEEPKKEKWIKITISKWPQPTEFKRLKKQLQKRSLSFCAISHQPLCYVLVNLRMP